MIWKNIHKVYFLGIGGIGMSALARYFLVNGFAVSGYDRSPSPITQALENEGAQIIFDDDIQFFDKGLLSDKDTLFIYTPAIPKTNRVFQLLIKKEIKLYKRAEILGELSKNYKTIAIAGTHGKTTVSSMAAHIMNTCDLGCQAFLGGITKNYESNIITHASSEWMVVEADEYDRSFLQLFPQIALITAMDADHLDIYGNHENLIDAFRQFTEQIQSKGSFIIKYGLKEYFKNDQNYYTYDLSNTNADFYAEDIELINHQYHFSLKTPQGKIKDLQLSMPGIINLENAIAACSTAVIAGAKHHKIKEAILSFLGIKRRMDLVLQNENISYYDDYAHHPQEINAAISSIKALYPQEELTVVFQPHLFSRTQDFAKGFAQNLDKAEHIILLDIYPAREEPIKGVSSQSIIDFMQNSNNTILSKDALVPYLKEKKPSLLLTLGAGDIDRLIEPIKNCFI